MYVDMRAQTWPCSPWINVATHKSQSCCFPGLAVLQNAEVSQLWCLGVPGVAPRAVYIAAGCTHVFALLVAVKVQLRMLAAEQHGHPCTFWSVPWTLRRDVGPFLEPWACMLFALPHCVLSMYMYKCLYYVNVYIYIYLFVCIYVINVCMYVCT